MDRLIRVSVLLTLGWATLMSSGCGEIGSKQPPASTVVPISDLKTVAGKWEGVLKRQPPASSMNTLGEDWLTLTIEDSGSFEDTTFEFESYRTIGVLMGSGSLHLRDGRLESESEKGGATYTLHERDGKSVLIVQAHDRKGVRYRAELTPAKR
jgi:hypothetical protein